MMLFFGLVKRHNNEKTPEALASASGVLIGNPHAEEPRNETGL